MSPSFPDIPDQTMSQLRVQPGLFNQSGSASEFAGEPRVSHMGVTLRCVSFVALRVAETVGFWPNPETSATYVIPPDTWGKQVGRAEING